MLFFIVHVVIRVGTALWVEGFFFLLGLMQKQTICV